MVNSAGVLFVEEVEFLAAVVEPLVVVQELSVAEEPVAETVVVVAVVQAAVQIYQQVVVLVVVVALHHMTGAQYQ